MYIVRSWTVLVHVHRHMYRTVPFSVFTATVLVGPSPCQWVRCVLYTIPNSPVVETTWHGTLSACCASMHNCECTAGTSELLLRLGISYAPWLLTGEKYSNALSSIKLAVYTFFLHNIYLHALHITSYLINLMFISCYHLSSCTHNTLYILTLQ